MTRIDEKIPVGYKKTKVGVIPEEWALSKLDMLEPFITSGSRGWASYYTESGSYFIRITNLSRESIILDIRKPKFVTLPANGKEGQRTKLEAGDLLISITADLGIIGFIDELFEENAYVSQHISLIRIRREDICNRFIAYFLAGPSSQKNFLRITDQGAKAGLNLQVIRNLPVIIPSLPEQEKIAEILSKWDEGIEKTEKLIELKEKRKKALMQQLLTGKKRFARFANKCEMKGARCEENEQSEADEHGYPIDWEQKSLGDLFEEIKEKVGNQNITPYSISAGIGFVSQAAKWGKNIAGKQYEKYTHIKRGDFAYNKGNSKKYKCGCIYLLEEHDEISVPNVFISFRRRDDSTCSEFYKHYFLADTLARQLKRIITSGARSDGLLNLNKKDFFAMSIPVPSAEEQKEIAKVLDCADKEIAVLKSKLDELKQQKKGLMQQLLTGKTRVV